MKKLFLYEFIDNLKLTKNNNFTDFFRSYNFFIDSLKSSYKLNYISSKSKAYYS